MSVVCRSQTNDFDLVKSKAEAGDAHAQDQLGTNYRIEHNFTEAMKWYRAAAKQGLPQAAFNVATMYYNGDGVNSDLNAAYTWFVVANAEGDGQAAEAVKRTEAEISPQARKADLLRAAEMFRRNEFVPPNKPKAIELLRSLAEQNDPVARVRLARMLIIGNELGKDLDAADSYCRPAAKQGYSPAMICVAYLDEVREPRQYKDAFEWYQLAAAAGNPIGHYGMGQLYAQGLGVKPDNVKAALSLSEAAPVLKTAQDALATIEARLTAKEQQQLAKEKRKKPAYETSLKVRSGGKAGLLMDIDTQLIGEFPLVMPIEPAPAN
jgi:TPR repeat protein